MNIAIIGYGKMGHMIEQIATARGHKVVCIIDIDNRDDMDSDAFRSADVAIEFTAPHVAYDNYLRAWEQGVKVVSGSTGWTEEHGEEVRSACTEGGKTLFWASNFSVGVAIFDNVNRFLARIMNGYEDYRPSLEETHHTHKLDAPSGTAITLAEGLIENVDRIDGWRMVEAHNTLTESTLPVSAIRRGEVPGIHTIRWDSEADCISITHDAHSRKGFALGAVVAAEYTATHQGLLTMKDLFRE
ncbi:MAG: 4-hydroxy-tetrahydrodipicolinate reductase [Bacteroidaceae bacterium]|nr:4-hydroxy-tetrahydrodipicolinate reductase [Bacteroidaceae bacterium]